MIYVFLKRIYWFLNKLCVFYDNFWKLLIIIIYLLSLKTESKAENGSMRQMKSQPDMKFNIGGTV